MYAVPSSNGRANSTIKIRKHRHSEFASDVYGHEQSLRHLQSSFKRLKKANYVRHTAATYYWKGRRLVRRLRMQFYRLPYFSRILLCVLLFVSLICSLSIAFSVFFKPNSSAQVGIAVAFSGQLMRIPSERSRFKIPIPTRALQRILGVHPPAKRVSNPISSSIAAVINDLFSFCIALASRLGQLPPLESAKLTKSLGNLFLSVRASVGGFSGIAASPVHALRSLFRVFYTFVAALKELLHSRLSMLSFAFTWFKRVEWMLPAPEEMTEERVRELMPGDSDSLMTQFTKQLMNNRF